MGIFVHVTPVTAAAELSPWLVSLLGLGMVFVGLMSLILICTLMGMLFRALTKSKKKSEEAAPSAPAAAPVTEIPDRGAFVAAVSAALAEELGTDVAGLRILSIRRM